ncbi:hypothetical protein [Alteromonas sp. W364]|uniref:tetratricopeptide repeat protein n=1 Tax=Alteromonas sp. W364 TaxID=3075610 RepID=UPI0028883AEE|nr:hypothetical protein [Alteromonas sp. W364]MDT0629613.1 hypothetical protein [Alteromonas sp. W364]
METRKRKRGIKASRVKLEAAMLDAGIETQFALASKIAESEGLEKIPKDLVSKVFRERAVSTHNLARVAKALQVEAHTIYLSSESTPFERVADFQIESELASQSAEDNETDKIKSAPLARGRTRAKVVLFSVIFLFICAFAIYLTGHSKQASDPSALSLVAPLESTNKRLIDNPLGKALLLIQTQDELKHIGIQLVDVLHSTDFIGAVMVTEQQTAEMSLPEILKKWQVHGVLHLSMLESTHYASIQMEMAHASNRALIFDQVVHQGLLGESSSILVARLHAHLKQFVSGEKVALASAISKTSMQKYLEAKDTLYFAHSYQDLDKALTLLKQAFQEQPDFAQAYAEACRAKVQMSWLKDETASLALATTYCQQAEEYNSMAPAVISAKAELLSRTGRALAAVEHLEPILRGAISDSVHDAFDPDAFALFAELLLVFTTSDELDSSERGHSDDGNIAVYAEKALSIAPDHWRAMNTLGNYYFAKGDIRAAAKRFASASLVVKQPVILANLGTMQMCFGELDKAKQTYLDLIDSASNTYLAYENLGSVLMFEHDFVGALNYKLKSIKLQPDLAIHQVWGSLAEVYLRNGNSELASQHYQKALRIAERDELLDNTSADGRLSKLYYQMKLNVIDPNGFQFDDLARKANKFLQNSSGLGLKSRSHLAWIAGQIGKEKVKQEIWASISQLCPVYKQSPELNFG